MLAASNILKRSGRCFLNKFKKAGNFADHHETVPQTAFLQKIFRRLERWFFPKTFDSNNRICHITEKRFDSGSIQP